MHRGSGITSDLQLMNKLRLYPKFDGVFPVDELPIHLSVGHGIIMNFEPHNLAGSHWVCAINDPHLGRIYVDPLGLPPPTRIDEYLGKDYLVNTNQYQPITSQDCGSYCYHFIRRFMDGKTPSEIFPGNLKNYPSTQNNLIVRKEFWGNGQRRSGHD